MKFVCGLVFTSVIFASGCQKGETSTQVSLQDPAGVRVTPATATVRVGVSAQLTASIPDLPGVAIAWASSDTSVALVSQAGMVSGRSAGDAVITASYQERRGATQISVVP